MPKGPGVSESENYRRILPDEFRQVQELAHRTFGLDIKDGKEALVSARLNRRMRAIGVKEVRRYLSFVQGDKTGQELSHLVDALTTNFTSFRREAAHFEILKTRIVDELPRTAEIRIWSAGCSSGEEPYSILFELLEKLGPNSSPRIKILGSDISGKVLEQAKRAVYPLQKLDEMPAAWRRYLEKGSGEWAGHFRIASAWRNLIDFRRINLMEPLGQAAQFHVIFCRNVMIYFDRPTQEDLVRRLAERLVPGGWLLIGHSEGLSGLRSGLKYIEPATYRRPGASAGS
jgi:chemotaxis protein methyltransferase CheR